MAVILFYDTTELDKQQLSAALSDTDHHWEYVDDKISMETINPDAEIISVFTTSAVTREMIEAMPRLTLICCRSTGFNNVDLEAANEHNVTVVNVPTYGEATVAEFAFSMLLALTRKLEKVLDIENEKFNPPELTGIDLFGKTFGVIGTGHIGQKSLKIANGFSMRTLAFDSFPKNELQDELHFTYVSLEELLAQSDFISLHVPYMPETHHLINKERIAMMKPGAMLINTARGGLVDTGALVEALDNGKIGGAALDVIEGEQLLNYEEETALLESDETPEGTLRHGLEISALKKMPNVIVSPHNAFNTVEAIGRINTTTANNIIGFYNHDTPNVVPYVHWEMGKLILLRHTESEWNASGIWTGMTDICLTDKGKEDCVTIGQTLKEMGLTIDIACHTDLTRTKETLAGVCRALGDEKIEKLATSGLNERDYGEYTGKNKWQVKEEIGEEHWQKIRRGWDEPIPGGETLKQVYERAVPVYKNDILPRLREGKNVMVVAHGNSLRALMKYLESIPDEKIEEVEMPICKVFVYEINRKTGLMRTAQCIDTDTTPNEIEK